MDYGLAWLLTGFGLVIAELLSGTFYLLVLGIACFAGALASYAGAPLAAQSAASGICALVGLAWVHRVRRKINRGSMPALDIGQAASFDSWLDKEAGRARVKYRDALWDASVSGGVAGEPGEVLYIASIHGNTLTVSKTRPA